MPGTDFATVSTTEEAVCENCGTELNTENGMEEFSIVLIGTELFCSEECAEEAGWRKCARCGEWVHEDDAIFVDDQYFCCDGCANESGYRECDNCGEWHAVDDGVTIDGEFYCSPDCAHECEYEICERCRRWFNANDGVVFECNGDIHYYCDDDCAESDGYVQCEHCFEWACRWDDAVYIGGDWYCSDDCVYESGYRVCERCGEWCHEDDDYTIYIDDNGCYYCCDTCAERDGYRQCSDCAEWHCEDDMTEVHHGRFSAWYCESCIEDADARQCDGCGEYFASDCITYNAETDEHLCRECSDPDHERVSRVRNGNGHVSEYHSALHNYGYHPPLRFFGGDAITPKIPLYMGVELETDGGSNRWGYIEELLAIPEFKEHFYMTEDGSLRNGVEITGQPMTLAHHLQIADMYEAIGEAATGHGFVSHNGGRCGLHVHVNRDWFGRSKILKDVGGYKMMRLLQRFQRQFMTFSRRDSDRWCSFHTDTDYSPSKKDGISVKTGNRPMRTGDASLFQKAESMSYETRHAQALNFQHPDTFEFRIFRGTLKWSTYYACLGMVNGLCHVAKEHGSEYIENVDWYALMNDVILACDEPKATEYLESYLMEKGLI